MPENAPSLQRGETQVYNIVRQRFVEQGIVALPTTGAASVISPVIARLHSPIEFLRITYEAKKIGAPPYVPSADMLESRLKLIRGTQSASVPMFDPEYGLHVWTMAGEYVYCLTETIGLDMAMATGKMPWEKGGTSSFTIPASAFMSELMDVPLQTGIVNPDL